MKKIVASILAAVVTSPIASFACGGSDCSMDLPAPEVPAPTTVENLMNSFAEHPGLFASMAVAAVIGFAVFRQRKLLETRTASPFLRTAP